MTRPDNDKIFKTNCGISPGDGGGATWSVVDPRSQAEGELLDSYDIVDKPKHYDFFPDLEAIQIIAMVLTEQQYLGYCLGNRLKYRLRAGNKDKLQQDIDKSDKYLELFEEHKHLCREQ